MILHLSEKPHFVSVFDIDDKKFLVDALSTELIVLDKGLRKHGLFFRINVSTVLYY